MTNIQNTTILSTFDLIRDAIIANSTLFPKFNITNIFQFEPKHKSSTFKGFPYFLVNIPELDTNKVVFDNNFTIKGFTVSIILRVDYLAKKKVLGYANAFIAAMEAYESTFQASGYYEVTVDHIDTNPNQQIEQKEVVEVEFSMTFKGQVQR